MRGTLRTSTTHNVSLQHLIHGASKWTLINRFLTGCRFLGGSSSWRAPPPRDALQSRVIKSFAESSTEALFRIGRLKRVPADVARRGLRRLEAIDAATVLADLRVPPGNRLHALKGDRTGQHAISVNDQWRICFRFEDGDAHDVEFCDDH